MILAELPDPELDELLADLESLGDPEGSYRDWLDWHFTRVVPHALSKQHVELWDWFESITYESQPRPFVGVWPRARGKSTTAELAVSRMSQTLKRHFVLIISETQPQADAHVQSISTWMESLGIERAVSKYGASKGWRRDQLRTKNGFNVAGYGLDVALRGIKIDEYRPDLLIFDDIDNEDDSTMVVASKVNAITTAIIPAASNDRAICFIGTLVHEDSIMSQLVEGRAEFLHDRVVSEVVPAVDGLDYVDRGLDVQPRYLITAGEATWPEGQPIEVCQNNLNTWGERSFLREAQHKVKGDSKYGVYDSAYLRMLLEEGILPFPLRQNEDFDLVPGVKYEPTYRCGDQGLSGELEIWEEPVWGVRYVIGADVAEGLKKDKTDESTADILRLDTQEQVGSYYGKPKTLQFALDLYNLSEWYNRGILIVENNTFGVGVIERLGELGAKLWDIDPSKTGEKPEDHTAGFRTLPRSKGLIDSELQNAILEAKAGRPSLRIRSRRCAEQCLHYVELHTGGRGGEGSWHDDHVRSLGLAWYVARDYGLKHRRMEQPKTGRSYSGYHNLRG